MNKSDKNLVKESALVIADNIVTATDLQFQTKTGIPLTPFGTAWGLAKALFGNAMKMRQERVLELVETIKDKPETFTKQVLTDSNFQDGFVYSLEKYIIERSKEKRRVFRHIFLGFAQVKDKNAFSLEKYIHTLSQLSELDISVLKDVKVEEQGQNYQIYGENSNGIDSIYNLISQGILLNTTRGRSGHNFTNSPFVKVSTFGREFIKYIN